MDTNRQRMLVRELNPSLICVLCGGYFIDATTLNACLHTFCKTCIVQYLQTSKHCPVCDVMVHKTKPHLHIRADKTLQDLVYKLIPGLYKNEMKRRRDFYIENPHDDPSRIGEERGDENADRLLYSEDDKFSVSLHFCCLGVKDDGLVRTLTLPEVGAVSKEPVKNVRYLECPAGVTVDILKRFVRHKYELPSYYMVDIFHSDESLRDDYTLMDIAYIYTWRRKEPLKLNFSVYEFIMKRRKVDRPGNTRLLDFKNLRKQENKIAESKAEDGHIDPKAEHRHTESKAEDGHTDPKAENKHTYPKAEHGHTYSKAEHRHTDPKAEHRQTESKAELRQTESKVEHRHTNPRSEYKHNDPKAEHRNTDPKDEHKHTSPKDEHRHTDIKAEQGEREHRQGDSNSRTENRQESQAVGRTADETVRKTQSQCVGGIQRTGRAGCKRKSNKDMVNNIAAVQTANQADHKIASHLQQFCEGQMVVQKTLAQKNEEDRRKLCAEEMQGIADIGMNLQVNEACNTRPQDPGTVHPFVSNVSLIHPSCRPIVSLIPPPDQFSASLAPHYPLPTVSLTLPYSLPVVSLTPPSLQPSVSLTPPISLSSVANKMATKKACKRSPSPRSQEVSTSSPSKRKGCVATCEVNLLTGKDVDLRQVFGSSSVKQPIDTPKTECVATQVNLSKTSSVVTQVDTMKTSALLTGGNNSDALSSASNTDTSMCKFRFQPPSGHKGEVLGRKGRPSAYQPQTEILNLKNKVQTHEDVQEEETLPIIGQSSTVTSDMSEMTSADRTTFLSGSSHVLLDHQHRDNHQKAGQHNDGHQKSGQHNDSRQKSGQHSDSHQVSQNSDSHQKTGRHSDGHQTTNQYSDSHRKISQRSDNHQKISQRSDSHQISQCSDSHHKTDQQSDKFVTVASTSLSASVLTGFVNMLPHPVTVGTELRSPCPSAVSKATTECGSLCPSASRSTLVPKVLPGSTSVSSTLSSAGAAAAGAVSPSPAALAASSSPSPPMASSAASVKDMLETSHKSEVATTVCPVPTAPSIPADLVTAQPLPSSGQTVVSPASAVAEVPSDLSEKTVKSASTGANSNTQTCSPAQSTITTQDMANLSACLVTESVSSTSDVSNLLSISTAESISTTEIFSNVSSCQASDSVATTTVVSSKSFGDTSTSVATGTDISSMPNCDVSKSLNTMINISSTPSCVATQSSSISCVDSQSIMCPLAGHGDASCTPLHGSDGAGVHTCKVVDCYGTQGERDMHTTAKTAAAIFDKVPAVSNAPAKISCEAPTVSNVSVSSKVSSEHRTLADVRSKVLIDSRTLAEISSKMPAAGKTLADVSNKLPADSRPHTDISSKLSNASRVPIDVSGKLPTTCKTPEISSSASRTADVYSKLPTAVEFSRTSADVSSKVTTACRTPADISSKLPTDSRAPADVSNKLPADSGNADVCTKLPADSTGPADISCKLQTDTSLADVSCKLPADSGTPAEVSSQLGLMNRLTTSASVTKGFLSNRNGMPTVVARPARVSNAATSVNTLRHKLPVTFAGANTSHKVPVTPTVSVDHQLPVTVHPTGHNVMVSSTAMKSCSVPLSALCRSQPPLTTTGKSTCLSTLSISTLSAAGVQTSSSPSVSSPLTVAKCASSSSPLLMMDKSASSSVPEAKSSSPLTLAKPSSPLILAKPSSPLTLAKSSSLTVAKSSSLTVAKSQASLAVAKSPAPVTVAKSPVPVTQTQSPAPVTRANSPDPLTQTSAPSSLTHTRLPAPLTQTRSSSLLTQTRSLSPLTQTKPSAPLTEAMSLAPTEAKSSAPLTEAKSSAPLTEAKSSAPLTEAKSSAPLAVYNSSSPLTVARQPALLTVSKESRRASDVLCRQSQSPISSITDKKSNMADGKTSSRNTIQNRYTDIMPAVTVPANTSVVACQSTSKSLTQVTKHDSETTSSPGHTSKISDIQPINKVSSLNKLSIQTVQQTKKVSGSPSNIANRLYNVMPNKASPTSSKILGTSKQLPGKSTGTPGKSPGAPGKSLGASTQQSGARPAIGSPSIPHPKTSSTPVLVQQPLVVTGGSEGAGNLTSSSPVSVVMAARRVQLQAMAAQAKQQQQLMELQQLQMLQQQHYFNMQAVAALSAGFNPLQVPALLAAANPLQVRAVLGTSLSSPQPLSSDSSKKQSTDISKKLTDSIKKPSEGAKKARQVVPACKKVSEPSPKKKITDIANSLHKKISQTMRVGGNREADNSCVEQRPPLAHGMATSSKSPLNSSSSPSASSTSGPKTDDEQPLNLVMTRNHSSSPSTQVNDDSTAKSEGKN